MSKEFWVWCFVGANNLWAITTAEDGSNLPAENGPWHYLKAVALTGSDPDEREAGRLVAAQGFCCFQGHDPDQAR